MPGPATPPAAPPAAAPAQKGPKTFNAGEIDEIFGPNVTFATDDLSGKPQAPAPAAPAPTPVAQPRGEDGKFVAAPAAEAAPVETPPVDPNAAAPAVPDAGTTPEGQGDPAAAAIPAAAETKAEIEARVLREVVTTMLGGKKAPPSAAAPAPPPEPPHIQLARKVAALSEADYKRIYDIHIENAKSGKDEGGFDKAERLASLRENAPYHLDNYDRLMEIQERSDREIRASQEAAAQAAVKALDTNPMTKDWRTYRETMVRLQRADEAAQDAGLPPTYPTLEDCYLAARAIHSRGKAPALPPAAAAAKAAMTGATPASRGGPAIPPATPTTPKGDDFLDEVFKDGPDPFSV